MKIYLRLMRRLKKIKVRTMMGYVKVWLVMWKLIYKQWLRYSYKSMHGGETQKDGRRTGSLGSKK